MVTSSKLMASKPTSRNSDLRRKTSFPSTSLKAPPGFHNQQYIVLICRHRGPENVRFKQVLFQVLFIIDHCFIVLTILGNLCLCFSLFVALTIPETLCLNCSNTNTHSELSLIFLHNWPRPIILKQLLHTLLGSMNVKSGAL
nr:hypothetical protein Itr_chr14CG27920 [Ipomoea trifida]